jgi:hypothetical protein
MRNIPKELYRPDHPNARKNGVIAEYRLRAATALGRPLPAGVEVHHYKEELVICEDESYHKLLHVRQGAFEGCGDPHKRKCNCCKCYDDLSNLVEEFTWKINAQRDRISGYPHYHHRSCKADYDRRRWQRRKKERESYADASLISPSQLPSG